MGLQRPRGLDCVGVVVRSEGDDCADGPVVGFDVFGMEGRGVGNPVLFCALCEHVVDLSSGFGVVVFVCPNEGWGFFESRVGCNHTEIADKRGEL